MRCSDPVRSGRPPDKYRPGNFAADEVFLRSDLDLHRSVDVQFLFYCHSLIKADAEGGDVTQDFDKWIQIELPRINKMLEGRGLPRIEPGRVSP